MLRYNVLRRRWEATGVRRMSFRRIGSLGRLGRCETMRSASFYGCAGVEKGAIGGEGGDLGLGAAEVDADADIVGRADGRMVRRCGVWLKAGVLALRYSVLFLAAAAIMAGSAPAICTAMGLNSP